MFALIERQFHRGAALPKRRCGVTFSRSKHVSRLKCMYKPPGTRTCCVWETIKVVLSPIYNKHRAAPQVRRVCPAQQVRRGS